VSGAEAARAQASFSLRPVSSTIVSKPEVQPQLKAWTLEKVAPLRRSIIAKTDGAGVDGADAPLLAVSPII